MTWASEHPHDVSGVVLVDASSAWFAERAMQGMQLDTDEPLSSERSGT